MEEWESYLSNLAQMLEQLPKGGQCFLSLCYKLLGMLLPADTQVHLPPLPPLRQETSFEVSKLNMGHSVQTFHFGPRFPGQVRRLGSLAC